MPDTQESIAIIFRNESDRIRIEKTGISKINFRWSVNGEGYRRKAIIQPHYYKKGTIEYIGRRSGYDHFLCGFNEETPTLFIGNIE